MQSNKEDATINGIMIALIINYYIKFCSKMGHLTMSKVIINHRSKGSL